MTSVPGIPIVVSGPSGVGKGTLVSMVLKSNPLTAPSISMTTRPPRPGEQEGVNYFFVDRNSFLQAIARNELLEWAEVYGNFYGTPCHHVRNQMARGIDVIMEIDVQGAAMIKSLLPNSVLIYIVPPSLEELKRRLFSRARGTGDLLEQRYRKAVQEMRCVDMFDYVVVNEVAEQAAEEINRIILALRHRTARMKQSIERLQISRFLEIRKMEKYE
jgi:guanylate kinase